MKSKIHKGIWNLNFVQQNNDKLYVFGDNQMRIGKKGQAVIRDAENSIGIVTKKSPSRRSIAYFNDTEFEKNKGSIVFDILNIKYRALSENKIIVFSNNGYGNGLSEMNTRSPKTYDFLNTCLKENFSFDNKKGSIVNIIPGYDEIKNAFYIDLTKDNKDIIMPLNNSFFIKEYLNNNMLTLYDLISYHKKISFTHKKSSKFNPDDIIIFKFDNIKNRILCRVSQTFDINSINKDKWVLFEGFNYDTEITNDFVQTHFKYISILDSNNNMILPGDLFSNIKDSSTDNEIIQCDPIQEDPKLEKIESVENVEIQSEKLENDIERIREDKILDMLNSMKRDFVSKEELAEYSNFIISEILSRNEKPKSLWEKIFGK